MNNRIRELAEQARWQEIVIEDGEEWIHAHFNEQKFAELIIEECADLLDKELTLQKMEKGVVPGDLLKQHFGVE